MQEEEEAMKMMEGLTAKPVLRTEQLKEGQTAKAEAEADAE